VVYAAYGLNVLVSVHVQAEQYALDALRAARAQAAAARAEAEAQVCTVVTTLLDIVLELVCITSRPAYGHTVTLRVYPDWRPRGVDDSFTQGVLVSCITGYPRCSHCTS